MSIDRTQIVNDAESAMAARRTLLEQRNDDELRSLWRAMTTHRDTATGDLDFLTRTACELALLAIGDEMCKRGRIDLEINP